MLYSRFSTFRAKLLPKSEISKIELVAEFPGVPGVAEFFTPGQYFFSKLTRLGGGCQKELTDPLNCRCQTG